MKRVVRGILPPAKKMAKRVSGESVSSKLEAEKSVSAMQNLVDEAKAAKSDINGQNETLTQGSLNLLAETSEELKAVSVESRNSIHKNISKASMGPQKSSIGRLTQNETTNFLQLATPVKSENDKKEYKVVKLPNGLTALLISDVRHLIELEPADCTLDEEMQEAEHEAVESEGETESEDDSSSSDDCATVKDGQKSQAGEEKLAALALSVGVGSFNDPENIPGLAHFLEHMVFMGSEKFPQENDFDEYVKKHGGFDNACTYCELTCFFFECHEKKLLRTMDRFAQFFISPLMKRDAMTRERESIESEFQMTITSDDDRKAQLFSSMAVDQHPATKFAWGNLKTLRDNVTDDQLYEAVHNFRIRHYSAQHMCLAVQARLPLETLEKWVGECFSTIPNNDLPQEDFSKFRENSAFNPDKFCKLYTVNPVKDVCQVEISWCMPPQLHLYRKKPLEYLSWFLGHEGRGSLLSHLRKKVWALGITSDTPDYDYGHNSLYRLFSLTIILTKEGMVHLSDVVEAVFAYIKLLQNKGPQEWIFKEIQSIEEASFRFVEEVPAADYVESLAENMHRYPPEDYITGDELYFEYDPDAIMSILKQLRADNVNVMASTKTPPEGVKFDRTEPWFGTQYHVKDIPQDWIAKWSKVEPYPGMSLPEKNPFITTDFSILPEEEGTKDQLYPVKLVDTKHMELWYRRDHKFLVPNAFLNVYLLSPIVAESPINCVMMDVFIATLKQQLMEDLYPARMADLEYELLSKERGWTIRCWGFNEKVPMLLETFIKGIKTFNEKLDDDMFAAIKDKIQKYYSNVLLKPEDVATDVRASLIQQNYWTTVDKCKAIKEVDRTKLEEFINRFSEELFIQFLAQGNITKAQAIKIGENVVSTLNCKPLPREAILRKRVLQIPTGERVCRVSSFNKEDANCLITNYYQAGLGTVKELSIIEMLIMLMEEPLFNILRTREQLGYYVYCMARDTYGILGYSVSVHSQADKHTVEHVDSRIEAFIETFSKDLKQMKTDEFNLVLQSLIKLKNCTDVHLQEEVDRNWNEIRSQEYMFDRRKKSIESLRDLKASTVWKWLNNHSLCGDKSNVRKLSIQVMAKPSKEKKDAPNVVEENGEDLTFELLPKTDEKPDYFIRDIRQFKEDLYVYPAHKLDSS